MRILQVCPKYYPEIGGIEQHVKNISERLSPGHDVTVFAGDPSGRLPREEIINGVNVRRFLSFSPKDAYHISFDMLKELRRSSFDVVHGHGYHAFPMLFSRYAKANRFVVNTYYHGHGHTPFRNLLFRLYKPVGGKAVRSADAVVALSNYEKSLLVRDFQLNSKDVAVIPYGIDLAEFKSLHRKKGEKKKILFVGRLEEYKGVQYIIQALPLVETGIHLEIIGRGPYKNKLVDIVARLGLQSRVHFYEGLKRDELLARYASSDLFVMLSKYETFSIVVAEALAAGVPCVVANTSALTEWVDNENCYGIDYSISIEKLAGLIRDLMGKRVGGVKLWDWDEVMRETLKVYQA